MSDSIKNLMKKLEDLKLNEKRQSIDTNTQITDILELCINDFKAAILKRLKKQIKTQLKQMKSRKCQQRRRYEKHTK